MACPGQAIFVADCCQAETWGLRLGGCLIRFVRRQAGDQYRDRRGELSTNADRPSLTWPIAATTTGLSVPRCVTADGCAFCASWSRSRIVLGIAGGVAYTSLIKPLRALAKMPDRHRQPGGIRHQDHHAAAAHRRLHHRQAGQYELTAQAAARDLLKPDVVELQGLHATMEMQNNVSFKTTANNGFYDTKSELLTLEENILVTTSSGYQARAGRSRDRHSRRQDRLGQAGRGEIVRMAGQVEPDGDHRVRATSSVSTAACR